MAEIHREGGKTFRVSFTAPGEGVNTYILGDASDGKVGTIVLCFVPGAGFAGSFAVKARPRNPEAAQPIAPPMPALPVVFAPIPYLALNTAGAAVSPPAWSSAAITAACIIVIPASGLSIAIDLTAITAGDGWFYWTPLEGHAAVV